MHHNQCGHTWPRQMVQFTLKAVAFEILRLSVYQFYIYVSQVNEGRLTGVHALIRRWQQWGGRSEIGSSAVRTLVHSPFVRCVKGSSCEAKLSRFSDAFCAGEAHASKMAILHICCNCLPHTPFLISDFGSWTKHFCFDALMSRSKRFPVLAG